MDRINLLPTVIIFFMLVLCTILAVAALTSHPNTSEERPIRHDTRYIAHQIPGDVHGIFHQRPNLTKVLGLTSTCRWDIRSLNPMHANGPDSHNPLAYKQWMNAEDKRC